MRQFTLNLNGRLVAFDRPAVMGIINITPDSFYDASRSSGRDDAVAKAKNMIACGADMLDIGACSTRPGAEVISEQEETDRLAAVLPAIREEVGPDIPISVDTFRARVAKTAILEMGANIVNDISGGTIDRDMFESVAELKCPYILMHMRGNPANMMELNQYENLIADIISELGKGVSRLEQLGVADIIIDPGFGFSKDIDQNYQLMAQLNHLTVLDRPILVGVSRKSMITRLLDLTPHEALEGTTALNAFALDRGASILRVHDVLPAVQTIKIFQALNHKKDSSCSI